MKALRCRAITEKYRELRLALVGDFCLDRYLEIDPARQEISIETGRPVHNVTRVRSQPGAAGTILNNLVALGIGTIYPVGFAGEDGEGYELTRAVNSLPGVRAAHFLQTPGRRTFTYTKPLVINAGQPPLELDRLDLKNWSPTPPDVEAKLIESVLALASEVDAIILMDQVDVAETGVVTSGLLAAVERLAQARPELMVLADSRRGLQGYPKVSFKMNRSELGKMVGRPGEMSLDQLKQTTRTLARQQGQACFVTLAECGILGATPDGAVEHVPALPVHGEIDIVGAGDSITANLTAALAAGATLREALELANAAASTVIHQLGTTGAASVQDISQLVVSDAPPGH